MRKHRLYHLLGVGLVLACLPAAAAAPGDGMVLLSRDSPDYAALPISPAITSHPDAPLRLLVFRDNAVVFNHGLRDNWSAPRNTAGGVLFEGPSVVDSVELSPDSLTAILMETRIGPPKRGGALEGSVGITWIDPGNPRGRWSVELRPGRFIRHIHVLDLQSGFALMTDTADGDSADFTLYNPEGGVEYHLDEVTGTVLEFRITRAGAFIGLDIAYPERPDLPDRTILVLDRLQTARWGYSWSYGDSREPIRWTLMDNGVLEIRTPGKTMRYDRTGVPIIPANRKRRQKRVLN